MDIAETNRRLAGIGVVLLPHQLRAVESDAEVVVLSGDSCTGKTFTAVPWLLTRDPLLRHAMLAPTMHMARLGVTHSSTSTLQRMGIDYVFGRRPPTGYGNPCAAGSCRSVLSVRDGASVTIGSLSSAKQMRGFRLDSLFVDECESFQATYDDVVDLINRSRYSLLTAKNAAGLAMLLRRRGVAKSIEIVRAGASADFLINRFLDGVRIAV